MPKPGDRWVAPTGEAYELDEYLGEGMFACTYGLKGQPDRVIKLYPPKHSLKKHNPARMVEDTLEGAEILRREGIGQLDVVKAETAGDMPFIVQRRIPGDSGI